MKSPVSHLHRYKAILFDMNETFMFGGDRLGPGKDFHATYRTVGGSALSAEAVAHCVGACVAGFLADYANPALIDDFPSLQETIARHCAQSRHEIQLLELVIARHEVGAVPGWAAQVILTLARSHRLGVVSNLWAPSHHWEPELRRSQVAGRIRIGMPGVLFGPAVHQALPPVVPASAANARPAARGGPLRWRQPRTGHCPGKSTGDGNMLGHNLRPLRGRGGLLHTLDRCADRGARPGAQVRSGQQALTVG